MNSQERKLKRWGGREIPAGWFRMEVLRDGSTWMVSCSNVHDRQYALLHPIRLDVR